MKTEITKFSKEFIQMLEIVISFCQ